MELYMSEVSQTRKAIVVQKSVTIVPEREYLYNPDILTRGHNKVVTLDKDKEVTRDDFIGDEGGTQFDTLLAGGILKEVTFGLVEQIVESEIKIDDPDNEEEAKAPTGIMDKLLNKDKAKGKVKE